MKILNRNVLLNKLPMLKYSTLIYLINSPERHSSEPKEVIHTEHEDDFNDVYNYLDAQSKDVSEQTVQNILGFMKSYKVLENKNGKKTGMIIN